MKFGVITGSLGNIGDRYCLGGYKAEVPLEAKLKRFAQMPHLDGVEISQDEIKGATAKDAKAMLDGFGLTASAIGIDLTSDPMWQMGSVTSKDAKLRAIATDKLKKTIDFCAEVGTGLVNVWLGQDGFDYPFQADYAQQWADASEVFAACADHNPAMKLALEPKPREPRNRSFIDSTATALLLVTDIGRANLGVTLDVGHILQEGKNMAQSIAYAHAHGKLFNLHINDNYGSWDDDLIVGSVHTAEFIEMFYVLRKIGYDKWCAVDIFPYREDGMRAAEESIAYMHAFEKLIDRIGMPALDACVAGGNPIDAVKLIRETVFG